MLGKNHMITATTILAGQSLLCYDMAYGFGVDHLMIYRAGNLALWYLTDTADIGSPWLYYPLAVMFFLAGAVSPDIDTPSSMLGRKVHIGVKHRTWTHSIWFVLLFLIPGIFLFKPLVFLAYGAFLHILCDSFSAEGVHWLYPLKNKHHICQFYNTGEISEVLFTVILEAIVIIPSIIAVIRLLS